MSSLNKYWFVRKSYGYGWTPATREGWLVLLLWFGAFISSLYLYRPTDADPYTGTVLALTATALLLVVCYLKGEKPKWQWGRPKKGK